jgi:hypothetical protein
MAGICRLRAVGQAFDARIPFLRRIAAMRNEIEI